MKSTTPLSAPDSPALLEQPFGFVDIPALVEQLAQQSAGQLRRVRPSAGRGAGQLDGVGQVAAGDVQVELGGGGDPGETPPVDAGERADRAVMERRAHRWRPGPRGTASVDVEEGLDVRADTRPPRAGTPPAGPDSGRPSSRPGRCGRRRCRCRPARRRPRSAPLSWSAAGRHRRAQVVERGLGRSDRCSRQFAHAMAICSPAAHPPRAPASRLIRPSRLAIRLCSTSAMALPLHQIDGLPTSPAASAWSTASETRPWSANQPRPGGAGRDPGPDGRDPAGVADSRRTDGGSGTTRARRPAAAGTCRVARVPRASPVRRGGR